MMDVEVKGEIDRRTIMRYERDPFGRHYRPVPETRDDEEVIWRLGATIPIIVNPYEIP